MSPSTKTLKQQHALGDPSVQYLHSPTYAHYALRVDGELIGVIRFLHEYAFVKDGSDSRVCHVEDDIRYFMPTLVRKLRYQYGYTEWDAKQVVIDPKPMDFDDVQMLQAFEAGIYMDYHEPPLGSTLRAQLRAIVHTLCAPLAS